MEYILTRWCLHKGLSFLYAIGFLIAINQYRALVGKNGILPIDTFIKRVRFRDAPSIFFYNSSDFFIQTTGYLGFILSLIAFFGISEQHGLFFSMGIWFLLWVLYQSFVNVGQVFYGFGWEILLLEAGFLAIFLGDDAVRPATSIIWLYRWLLFRVMFGAGLIKLRGDTCWKDCTAMLFHYETQPLPGPFSRFFHRLPIFIHKMSVLFTHFVEIVVPFFLFWPQKIACLAGAMTAFFQIVLLFSGNLSWLNWITIVLCFSCCNDAFLAAFFPCGLQGTLGKELSFYVPYEIAAIALTLYILFLSKNPIKNMLSSYQVMNCSFDPLHLVNTYGAFGSVTRERKEIILEGTKDHIITPETKWIPYEFKAKPGLVTRPYPQVSPYHYKIDWQMWFAAMSGCQNHPWFILFLQKLLQQDKAVLSLLKTNPFPKEPPHFIRAELYVYHFASPDNAEGLFWTRKYLGPYLPPVYLLGKEEKKP
jgi:hypothetical protein